MGLRDSYGTLKTVDINLGREKIFENDKTEWAENLGDYSKLDSLSKIKTEFGTERYLHSDLDRYDKSLLSQFRYRILQLEIETGRYKNLKREQRLCTIYNRGAVEGQIHFAFYCSAYQEMRDEFIETFKDRVTGWHV